MPTALFPVHTDALARRSRVADAVLGAIAPSALAPDQRDQLLQDAEAHGVFGLLPEALTAQSWPVLMALRARAMRNLRFTTRVVAALEGAAIPCVVLKGSGAGARWKEPGVRQQSDVDVLVAPEDLERASRALIDASVASHRFLTGEHMHNASLAPKEPSGLTIELHHTFNNHHDVRVDMGELLARRITVQTPQGPLPTFALEDDAVYLAMHASTHALQRLAWLVDLQALHTAQIDWVEAARRAKQWNISPSVACAWQETRSLLCVPIPEAAFDALGTPRVQRLAMRKLIDASRVTEGRTQQFFERVLRFALVPPLSVPRVLVQKLRAGREERDAYAAEAARRR